MKLRISSTGLRYGEIITSSESATQNTGTIMQVRGPTKGLIYPPGIKWVQALTADDLASLDEVSFFKSMSLDERKTYLTENSVNNNDLYLDTVPNLYVNFIEINGKFMLANLEPDLISQLIAGNPATEDGFWPLSEILALLSRKVKTKSLVFRPSNWQLKPDRTQLRTFVGLTFDLATLELGDIDVNNPGNLWHFGPPDVSSHKIKRGGATGTATITGYAKADMVAAATHVNEFVIISARSSPRQDFETLLNLVPDYAADIRAFKPMIEWFTPSIHKSLLQKLMRTRCAQVIHDDIIYDAEVVFITSFLLLLTSPKTFSENLRRWVSGTESACKRLAVSIHEDAYLKKSKHLTMMYALALVAQRDDYFPTSKHITIMLNAGLKALTNRRYYAYKNTKIAPFPHELSYADFSYILISRIGSFETDIEMVGIIASNNEPYIKSDLPNIIMPLSHCLDQHCLAEIVHYIPYGNVTYPEVMKQIWDLVTGVNTRKRSFPDTPKAHTIKYAQWLLWQSKTATKTLRELLSDEITITYTLDESWLAALIGSFEVKVGRINTVVVMRTDDIYEFTTVKKLGRGDTKTDLTDIEITTAVSVVQQKLLKGVIVDTPFGEALIELSNDEYYITLNKLRQPWSQFTHLTYTFPIHPYIEPTVLNAITTTGEGISERAHEEIIHYWNNLTVKQHNRIILYLRDPEFEIRLYKVSRSGKGITLTVTPEDTTVFEFLCMLCVLYPCGIAKNDNVFTVKNGPVIWRLRDILFKVPFHGSEWEAKEDDSRQLKEYQQDSVSRLIRRHEKGRRGHILYLPPGMGKTLIIIRYIGYLITTGQMPLYCVYTLPRSAVATVAKELELSNLPYVVLDTTLSGIHQTLLPLTVNVIVHDHLKKESFMDHLRVHADNVFFVIDEFHECMAATIRSSAVLEIAQLCHDFIGLTGTIIRDNNLDFLIRWLKQTVDYVVTKHNVWVAFGSVISKKVYTDVTVIREMVLTKFNHEAYYALVPPRLGGTASELKFRQALEVCYQGVTKMLVKEAVKFIDQGEIVFIVARDLAHQESIRDKLNRRGVNRIHLITKSTPIDLRYGSQTDLQAVITTLRFDTGYDLTACRIKLDSVYLSNQATRDQLDGRLNRISQGSDTVYYYTYYCGILKNINESYEKARNLSLFTKEFADVISEPLEY